MFKGSTLAINEENTNMAISRNKPYTKRILMFFLLFLKQNPSFLRKFFCRCLKRTVSLSQLYFEQNFFDKFVGPTILENNLQNPDK